MIMSIKALETSADFAPAKEASEGTSFWKGLLYTLVSVREGIDLAAEYRTLTSRGMATALAAQKVFERINKR
jgi:hypothetical protein